MPEEPADVTVTCRKCQGRGDVHWLVTHSHQRDGQNRLLARLWNLTFKNRKSTDA